MDILLIEDERKIAAALRNMLVGFNSGLEIAAVISSVSAGIKWLQTHAEPNLIIADIHLSDGLSFKIFSQVIISSPVIFMAAFDDQYAIQAFEANGIDYLLKPLEEQKLKKAIAKFQNFNMRFAGKPGLANEKLVGFASKMSVEYKRTLLVYYQEKILPVSSGDIDYVFVARGLVSLRTHGEYYTTQYTMEQLETLLNPQEFFRANLQFIINRKIILNAEHYFNRRLVVKVSCKTPVKIIISKEKVNEFLHWLEN